MPILKCRNYSDCHSNRNVVRGQLIILGMTSLDTSSVKPYGDNKNLFHAKKKQAQKTLRFNWCHFLVCIMCNLSNLKPGVNLRIIRVIHCMFKCMSKIAHIHSYLIIYFLNWTKFQHYENKSTTSNALILASSFIQPLIQIPVA